MPSLLACFLTQNNTELSDQLGSLRTIGTTSVQQYRLTKGWYRYILANLLFSYSSIILYTIRKRINEGILFKRKKIDYLNTIRLLFMIPKLVL